MFFNFNKNLILGIGLIVSLLLILAIPTYADSSQQAMMQELYQNFVQTDGQIQALVKQRLELKVQIAQHKERAETAIRPRVDRRQDQQIEELSEQMQLLSQKISSLEEQRSNLLLKLQ